MKNGAITEPGIAAIANQYPLLTSTKPALQYPIAPEILLIATKVNEVPAADAPLRPKTISNTGVSTVPPPTPTTVP